MSGIGQVVTLGVGDERFAVPVDRVQEILDRRRIARIPNAPAHVLGVIDVRGTGVSVVDLRVVLGLPAAEEDDATRIVVLWLETGRRRAQVALRTDRVFEVAALDGDRVEDVPEAQLLNWDKRLISGIGRRQGEFVTLLDLDRLFDALPESRTADPLDA
ncbi:chemotaxis protein CheW [Rhodovulum sp. BSW8]|uniref:Chemotaxis protein CheW n=1 Tax=Rhodovulum visakhapatnamense TaxID=364297 RepID=A0A4V3GS61_9RHOB|nr:MULTISPECIES: chemotaxis protein CheW [Rhodovulum]OLS44239.1 chemotaxis protein CheW [Rhodovulum sulfidophilum]MBL3571009.1 chemotaxis protein CheW [Rhodovulum visakhapatnamense]MBL3576674.1 chemotaxis protein CheW [Rhodovulum visakhapatnamense]RBO54309.1 chemotaxis protein CheW [Rhodovulum sp. BSW8]TDX21673.1 purine-binding chemotaxis protein CheW [Rhodovulum visakhapatnamense]